MATRSRCIRWMVRPALEWPDSIGMQPYRPWVRRKRVDPAEAMPSPLPGVLSTEALQYGVSMVCRKPRFPPNGIKCGSILFTYPLGGGSCTTASFGEDTSVCECSVVMFDGSSNAFDFVCSFEDGAYLERERDRERRGKREKTQINQYHG